MPCTSLHVLLELLRLRRARDHAGDGALCRNQLNASSSIVWPWLFREIAELFGNMPVRRSNNDLPGAACWPAACPSAAPHCGGTCRSAGRSPAGRTAAVPCRSLRMAGISSASARAEQQRILVLAGDERVQPAASSRSTVPPSPARREVGAANVAHLARRIRSSSARSVSSIGVADRVVDLIQVDPVGAQAAQAVLHRLMM